MMNTDPYQVQEELTPLGKTQSTELVLSRALHCLSQALDYLGVYFVVTGDYVGYEYKFYKVPKSLVIVLVSDKQGSPASLKQVQQNLCNTVTDGVQAFSYEKHGTIQFNDTLPSKYVTRTSCRIKLVRLREAHVDVQKACSKSRTIPSKNGPWRITPPIINILDALGQFPRDGHLKRHGQKVIQRLRHMVSLVVPGDEADHIFVSTSDVHFRTIRRIGDHIPEAYSYAPLIKYLDVRPMVATGWESYDGLNTYSTHSGDSDVEFSDSDDDDDGTKRLTELAKKLTLSDNSFSQPSQEAGMSSFAMSGVTQST